jgi:hypothetical protein
MKGATFGFSLSYGKEKRDLLAYKASVKERVRFWFLDLGKTESYI